MYWSHSFRASFCVIYEVRYKERKKSKLQQMSGQCVGNQRISVEINACLCVLASHSLLCFTVGRRGVEVDWAKPRGG